MASKYPPVPITDEPDIIERESLLEFPCKFPIKAMGRDEQDFESMVVDIVVAHAEIYADTPVKTNPSGSGKYISVTVTINAQSKDQLDRIYMDLTACEQVLVAL